MKFDRFGRTLQLHIGSPEDLTSVLALDETLWVATSAPVVAFQTDPGFLACLDTDADGRIQSDDVKAAIKEVFDRLADTSRLADGLDTIPLAAIRPDSHAASDLLAGARLALGNPHADQEQCVSLHQVRAHLQSVQANPCNGNGVIPPACGIDPETRTFLEHVLAATGGQSDDGDRRGVTEQQLTRFLEAIPAYLQWNARKKTGSESFDPGVMPLGTDTPAVHEIFRRNADAVDQFFMLCSLIQFDPALAAEFGKANPPPPTASNSADAIRERLRSAPIAMPAANDIIPLDNGTANPAYRDWLLQLRTQVLQPILGRDVQELNEADWHAVGKALAPYEAYLAENPAPFLDSMAPAILEHYLETKFVEKAKKLIDDDKSVTGRIRQVRELERLLLYHQHLMRFVNNFVSFPQLYSNRERALFEMGSVAMDGRWLNFAVEVIDNIPAHAAVAKASNLYVAYLEIAGPTNSPRKWIATPLTAGTKGNICVGKRGVFFDVAGHEHDARVMQIIENPVSLREALAMPFVRLWNLVEGKIEGWSGNSEKQLQAEFSKSTTPTPTPTPAPTPTTATNTARPIGAPGNMFMGVGVLVAVLGSAFAFITKTFAGMALQNVLIGVAVAALLVLLPVTLIAVLKLRRQDLSSLLEGSGWAVNARMRLTRGQRRHFTHRIPYPATAPGSRQRRRRILLLILLAIALAATLRHYMQSS